MNRRIKPVCYLLFLILLSTINAPAQVKPRTLIKGKITDANTGEPLPGASIYFVETTIGTSAKQDGTYTIEADKPGYYQLIVSIVGYEMVKKNYNLETGREYTLDFKLKPKPVNVSAVEITGEDQGEWRRDLKLFTGRFLGKGEAADYCTIENKEMINFKWAGDTLCASSPKPVVVINKFLGYKLICELVKYRYNPYSAYQEYSIYPRFEELTPADSSEKKTWEENREQVFNGSPIHFLWALKHDRLEEENFGIYFAVAPFNRVFYPVMPVTDLNQIKYFTKNDNEISYSFKGYLKVQHGIGHYSFIKMRVPFFSIDDYGIADFHLPFISIGEWAKLGVSELLPRGYIPDSLKKSVIKK